MNKKGLTLVEIIVSIGLISIVMVFLFQIIMTIKKANDRQNEKTDVLIAISIITREVEKDLNSFGLDETNQPAECKFDNKDNNNIVPNSATNMQCIKIIYDSKNVKNNEGYILYYTNNDKHFLAYKRGKGNVVETQTVREISVAPSSGFEINKATEKGYSLNIKIPIKNDYNIDTNLVINYAKSINNKVTIINKDGLAKQIKGNGIYEVGANVHVEFDYNNYLYEIDDIICNRGVCKKSDSFDFPMPNTDVTIYINLKEKPMNIIEYLTDIIDNNNPQNNPSADDIGLVTDPFNNIRFSGANPNNYIEFGNDGELWRIIGVFKDITTIDENRNEKTLSETLVKIVRDESLGQYSWDTAETVKNKCSGINDWSTSKLMQELNNDYLSLNPNNDNLLWHSKCTKGSISTAVYNYNNNIKKEYQTLIESVEWNIGGWNNNNISINDKNKPINGMYAKERENVRAGRPITWTGKIGLIYPTDYAFASEDAACKRLNNKECTKQNWLFKSEDYWTITYNSGSASQVWVVPGTESGVSINKEVYSSAYNVYPSLYLKADTKILRREGTKENPHLIYLENNE